MGQYSMFEDEVLARSKRLRFSSDKPFLNLTSVDEQINKDYFKLLFNAIMHKILTYKFKRFLSYQEYEIAFNQHITKQRKNNQWLFFYGNELVIKVAARNYKGRSNLLIYPCDEEIIKEDTLFMALYNKKQDTTTVLD
jgi:hypothetical protein